MRFDFEAVAQVQHAGSKGTIRENILRDFLADGRLPAKYGLGSGEIVGRIRDTSRQCDVVVYDKLNGVTLLYDDSVQVYPIDCVYGIVEVKSKLSKAEFLDALEKIKAFKAMSPNGAVSHPIGGGFTMVHARPRPFGAIFAYCLADNSIDSLTENLREWEKENPSTVWPNYVCVLNAGVINHHGKPFQTCLDSDAITAQSWPIGLQHGEDSLFQFYCALHDVCARMNLGPVELSHYYEPSIRIGRYVLRGRVEGQLMKDGKVIQGSNGTFSEAGIDKIVKWCSTRDQIPYGDVLVKQLGSMPLGMDDSEMVKAKVFFYNPDNLPGLHEIDTSLAVMTETGVKFPPSLASCISFDIDNQRYVVAMHGFEETDFEEVARLSE